MREVAETVRRVVGNNKLGTTALGARERNGYFVDVFIPGIGDQFENDEGLVACSEDVLQPVAVHIEPVFIGCYHCSFLEWLSEAGFTQPLSCECHYAATADSGSNSSSDGCSFDFSAFTA